MFLGKALSKSDEIKEIVNSKILGRDTKIIRLNNLRESLIMKADLEVVERMNLLWQIECGLLRLGASSGYSRP